MAKEDEQLAKAIRRVHAAAEYVHGLTCPKRGEHDWKTCMTSEKLTSFTTNLALVHLDQHPRDAATVRQIYHDAVCGSGCGPESDHAKRTQGATATALRKFHAQETSA